MSSGENILAETPKIVVQKVLTGHKNPSIDNNYHDENQDELEFYQRNSKRST